jgi:glycosyltransferase involved in cell wall biosynthesis
VLQVNTTDVGGGAAAIAFGLHSHYRKRGLTARMAVGVKRSQDPTVFEIPNEENRGTWTRSWAAASGLLNPLVGRVRGADRTRTMIRDIGSPARALKRRLGKDDFDYPGTSRILESASPDILHLHNLHGDYFDLRALPSLARSTPTLVTLHDSWLLGGSSPNPFGDGTLGPNDEITVSLTPPRDDTAENWMQKRKIYRDTKMVVVSPSRWLADLAKQSILAEAATKILVISNGIDQQVFRPGSRMAARAGLSFDQSVFLVLFAANGIRNNGFKDYPTIRAAVQSLSRSLGEGRFEFVGVGDDGPPEHFPNGRISFVPHVDRSKIAQYYQAADVYLHAARSDNFPNTVLEALSCGTPVVATAVGGIPEQVCAFGGYPQANPAFGGFSLDEATGILVGRGEGERLGIAAAWLAANRDIREKLAQNAAADASRRFSIDRQADDYLSLYDEMIAERIAAGRT